MLFVTRSVYYVYMRGKYLHLVLGPGDASSRKNRQMTARSPRLHVCIGDCNSQKAGTSCVMA